MNLDLSDKVALVTGASQGIGFGIAKALSEEACSVMISARNAARLSDAETSLGPKCASRKADATDPVQCEELVAETIQAFGRLDIVVCNVGSGRSAAPGTERPADWATAFELNLGAALHTIRAAEDALSRTGGAIVCVSSIAGLEVLGAPLTYSSAKAALNAYVRGAARPLAQKGIRINAVAPGNILFPGSVWERKLTEDKGGVDAMLEREVAMKRLGSPEEIGAVVAFIASSKASFMTGEVVVVDGGQVRGM